MHLKPVKRFDLNYLFYRALKALKYAFLISRAMRIIQQVLNTEQKVQALK